MAGEHGAHAAVPFAYVPTGHVDAVNAQEVAPAVLYNPAAQGGQNDAPPVLCVPAAQKVQSGAPAALDLLRYVPAGQDGAAQAGAPGALNADPKKMSSTPKSLPLNAVSVFTSVNCAIP